MGNYMVRNNQIEEVWRVEYSNKFFQQVVFIRGTEAEMRAYMESEFGYVGRYHACTFHELDAIETLGLKIYLAPEL